MKIWFTHLYLIFELRYISYNIWVMYNRFSLNWNYRRFHAWEIFSKHLYFLEKLFELLLIRTYMNLAYVIWQTASTHHFIDSTQHCFIDNMILMYGKVNTRADTPNRLVKDKSQGRCIFRRRYMSTLIRMLIIRPELVAL